jgi:Tudor domain
MMDYGDMQAVMETKALPQEFASIPPFATCCCMPMAATPNRHADLQAEVESELFVESAMTMRIIAVAAKEYLVVDFISKQSSLIEDKITKGLATSTFFEGYVSNVMSLEGVDVQNALWTNKLEAMSTSLENAESFPPLEKFQVGARCVAKFEYDGVFYRAQITSLKDSVVKVYFYDYGNSALVTDVRQAPDEILQVHHLSQLVKVCNPPPSEEVRDRMLVMLSDGCCKFDFLILNPTSFPLEVVVFKNCFDLRKLAAPGLNIMAVEFSPLPMVKKVGIVEKLEVCDNVLKRPHHQEADESINVPAKRASLSFPETSGKQTIKKEID